MRFAGSYAPSLFAGSGNSPADSNSIIRSDLPMGKARLR